MSKTPRTPPPTDPTAALRRHFGFDSFLPGQQRVITSLLDGHSAAAVFPTGGGKSLCYQLPALELAGTTLVVSPLIALMKDQIDALAARGHRALRLDSSLDAHAYREAMSEIRDGRAKLVYVAPERFNNERFRESLGGLRISLFAVDEAHCISEWGHNFRPDYLKLVRHARECGAERVLALTATATERVLADICDGFEIAAEHAVRTAFYRSNLTLLTTPVSTADRFETLARRLDERPDGATIVYVTQQRTAEQVAERLSEGLAERGLVARAYHAGMKNELRDEVQEWFFGAENPIVVATIAFGMGIDKADIRAVYHYNLPKSLESYSQEIGRAGRDQHPSTCELFACADDLNRLENFVYGDAPSTEAIGIVLQQVFGDSHPSVDLSLYELAHRSDARQLVIQTLLTYLELDGYLEAATPYYSNFEIHPLVDSEEILAHFEGERRSFLATVFRHSEKKRKWITLDLDSACRAHGAPRERAIRALDYLAEQEWLDLRVSGVRHRYRILRRPRPEEALLETMVERFARRERSELDRLQQVIALIENDGCQASRLGAHFSQPLDGPCGHCSWCLGDAKALDLTPRRTPPIPEAPWSEALELRAEHPDALGEPRAFTRFLCGISSPRASRLRLGSHPLWGALSEVPFATVLERVRRDGSPRA